MKRPLAYITAVWCGNHDTDTKQVTQYCWAVYEAGFSSVCPLLYLPLFLNTAIPEEHKNGIDMSRDLLCHSRVLVVRGSGVDEDVRSDIAVVGQPSIMATTLGGIPTVKAWGQEKNHA